MSESYVECLVRGRQNAKAKAFLIFLLVMSFVSAAATLFVHPLFIFLVIVVGIGIYFTMQYVNVEYEYLYLDKELVIDKIYNQAKRKRVATYTLDKIQVVAPIKSSHLSNFGKLSDKPIDYSIGYEAQPDLRYVMFYEGQVQIIFSPNEELVKLMKNQAPRKVFMD